ncbi:hypothetical protein [Streptomyces sp. NBC_01408]|uniref:hypothetical protein n=1 Tax=Streptomyces sp. NBC_01408 TaxID=2903855 RepID=UPI002255DC23|nr:hypothetical protein [Streptomyces sp. NBC_01408]MCX4695945.1 hypothetical protein [Streptomyces sp. NBC_01408]
MAITTQDLFPRRWPMPPDSCEECHQHALTRIRARAARDMSRVSDMNVMIRRHHPKLRPEGC